VKSKFQELKGQRYFLQQTTEQIARMLDARMVDDDHADSAPVLPFQTSSCVIMLACKRMFRLTVSVKTSNADTFNCIALLGSFLFFKRVD
jgi:hypothetical protein